MLLITGCPRSGTRYLASLLRAAGIRAFHERMGRDGTVNAAFAVDDFWYPGNNPDRPSRVRFDHVFHVVRHPLFCIASMASMNNPRFWHWTQLHTGLCFEDYESPLQHAARFWVKWNELVEKLSPQWRFKIESDFWPELCDRLGLGERELPEVDKHRSQHGSLAWADLGDAERGVREMAERYGY